jgi:hypothetical protein
LCRGHARNVETSLKSLPIKKGKITAKLYIEIKPPCLMGKKNGGERENGRNALLENGGWVDKRASGKGGMYIGAVIGGSLN